MSSSLYRTWEAHVSSARGLIFTGAGAITDDYSVHGIFSWALLAEIAHKHQVPIIFVGQGLGPLVDKRLPPVVARMLSLAEYVGVRADTSRELSHELGIAPGRVDVTPDWAIALEVDDTARRRAARLMNSISPDRPFIALSFHRRADTGRSQLRMLSEFAESVVAEADERGLNCLFIPNMTAGRYSDDRETADRIMSSWNPVNRNRVSVWREPGNPQLVKAMLGCATGLVTTRYHPMVFAFSEGVPAFGVSYDLYYDLKLSGVAQSFGVGSCVARLGSAELNAKSVVDTLLQTHNTRWKRVDHTEFTIPLTAFLERHGTVDPPARGPK